MSNPRIIQLDTLVSNQIAAGEVIERPASIIKELVENALDAKATQIDIEIEGAGVHLIRVRDNGIGIEKADLHLAFLRHATSKIRSSADLFAIQSLGFRGEALASIAAVSRCRLTSGRRGQNDAWQLEHVTGSTSEVLPAAHAIGTTVEVADLFYNVPVRRKFLRSPKTEFQSMDDMLKRLALSHPDVRFKLTHQQRLIRHFPAESQRVTANDRIAKICGQHFVDHALKVALTAGDLALEGWVGLPAFAHRQADCQYFFINQRMVKDRFIHHIIKTLFQQHPAFLEGSYPCYVLYLSCDPTQIDVNVHPTKQEVRFHQPRWVHDFISKTIRTGLENVTELPAGLENAMGLLADTVDKNTIIQPSWLLKPVMQARVYEPSVKIDLQTRRYAFFEKQDEIYKIDLQQAKSSLLSVYLQSLQGRMPTKTLLFPETVLGVSSAFDLSVIQSSLSSWGFQIQKQGGDWVLVQQPAMISMLSSEQLLELIQLNVKNESSQVISGFLAEYCGIECLFDLTVRAFDALLLRWVETAPLDYFAQIC